MSKLFISVVIPAYNEENYLKACLESLTNQLIPQNEYEVIVVNNNSTDNTEKVSRGFLKIRLVNEKRQGVVFARIKGVEEARGEIIAFIDADCIAPETWLKNIKQAYKSTNVVAVGGTLIYEPKQLITFLIEQIVNIFYLIFKTPPGANFSFKKEAYEKIGGFSPKINMSEDIYLSLALKKIGKVVILRNKPVITSSRRFTSSNFFPFVYQSIVNIFSLFFFNKSVFFDFEAIRENKVSLKKIISKMM